MSRVKVKPKYKELQGDPTKDSIRNIVNLILSRQMNGGTMVNKEMTLSCAITSKVKLSALSFVLNASLDRSVLAIFGAFP